MSSSRVLVTGATGFLGSHVVRRLVEQGCTVAAIQRRTSARGRLGNVATAMDWYTDEGGSLAGLFRRHGGFDVVIHTATCYGRHDEQEAAVRAANVNFPGRVLDAARSARASWFINTDTFFNVAGPIPDYLTSYVRSKQEFLATAKDMLTSSCTRLVNVRLEHVYGPDDDAAKFVPWVIRQCLTHVPVVEMTTAEQLRDFIFVEDAADAYAWLVQRRDQIPEAVTVGLGSGQARTVRSFVEDVHGLAGSRSTLLFGARPQRDNEIMASVADTSVLNGLGWRPATSHREGLRRTVAAEAARLATREVRSTNR